MFLCLYVLVQNPDILSGVFLVTSFIQYKRPLDSYACPDQSRGKMVKLTDIFKCKKFQTTCIFLGKGIACSNTSITDPKKPFFFGLTIATWRLGSNRKPHTNHPKDLMFLERCHLSHLNQPILSPLATFTGCGTEYYLLAPIY